MVPRRQRNRGVEILMVSLGWCYTGLLASIEGTAEGRRLVAQRASIMTFGAQNLKALSLCEDVRYSFSGKFDCWEYGTVLKLS